MTVYLGRLHPGPCLLSFVMRADLRPKPDYGPGRRKRYDPSEIAARAIELRKAEGLSYTSIATRLDVSPSTVQTALKEAGVKLGEVCKSAYRTRHPMRDYDAIVAKVQGLKVREPGLTMNELAARVGVPKGTLTGALSRRQVRLGGKIPRSYDKPALLAEALRLRREEGLAQWEAVQRLGLPQGTLSRWLRDAGIVWGETTVAAPPAPSAPPAVARDTCRSEQDLPMCRSSGLVDTLSVEPQDLQPQREWASRAPPPLPSPKRLPEPPPTPVKIAPPPSLVAGQVPHDLVTAIAKTFASPYRTEDSDGMRAGRSLALELYRRMVRLEAEGMPHDRIADRLCEDDAWPGDVVAALRTMALKRAPRAA